ncbi:MAG: Rap1a/Tai family immunity protein [Bacteroidota bacterium]|nr:Rap1a/Tai family immunity protein [Kiloniellaceae bacterium]
MGGPSEIISFAPDRRAVVWLCAAFLATGAAEAARAADPLFAHERPRYRSGEELLADCRSPEPAARGRCAGYVMAVADMLGGAAAQVDGLQACLDGDESLEELLGVVERHLEADPARAALKGDGIVAYALSLYRPCADSEASFEERLIEERSPPR